MNDRRGPCHESRTSHHSHCTARTRVTHRDRSSLLTRCRVHHLEAAAAHNWPFAGHTIGTKQRMLVGHLHSGHWLAAAALPAEASGTRASAAELGVLAAYTARTPERLAAAVVSTRHKTVRNHVHRHHLHRLRQRRGEAQADQQPQQYGQVQPGGDRQRRAQGVTRLAHRHRIRVRAA